MSFAGDLKKLPLGDVFQSIHQNSMTGALAVRDAHGERLVAFKAGFVVGCAGPPGEEHGIADELVRRRLLDQKDARPSRFFRRKGQLQKTVTKRNVLSDSEFVSLCKTVVLERVYDCFLLEEGTFEFLEKYDEGRFDEDELATGIKVAPTEILMEAMRRIDEFKRIRRAVPSFREVYVATRGPEEDDTPIARDILVLTAAGTLQLQAVFQQVAHTRFACCEAVLALLSAGAVRVATAPEYLDLGRKAEEKGDLDGAASYYARGLAYERGNADLNLRRIAVLEKLHRNQEAADERKLFAGNLLERGDKKGAAAHYSSASMLAPTDPLPLERLLDLHVEQKDLRESRDTADKLVRVYLQLGLGDKAKGVFPRLLVLAPRDRSLRERLADVHMRLNEPATAATIWKELAQEELDKGDVHDAAMFLRRALDAQPDDPRSQALLKDLQTGEHAERRKRLRLRVGVGVVTVLLALPAAQVAAEWGKLSYQRQLEQDTLPLLDRGPEAILGAIQARAAHRRAFREAPWAFGTRLEGWDREAEDGLVRLFVRALEAQAHRPPDSAFRGHDRDAEVMDAMNPVLDPKGGPKLEALVEEAEAALAKDDRDAAWAGLVAGLERANAGRLALARARPEARTSASLEEDQRRLRPLLSRLDLLWARLVLTDPRDVHVLEAEVASRLPAGK